MNKLITPLAVFFGLYLLWLFADNILDELDFFARFWWYIYHLILKASKIFTLNILSFFWNINLNFSDYRDLVLPDGRIITLWNKFLAYDVMALFSCFIIAWPSKWKYKIWYIPTGSFIIFLINNFLLSIIIKKIYILKNTLPTPDLDIYKTILYVVTAILWIIYIILFSNRTFLKSLELKKAN